MIIRWKFPIRFKILAVLCVVVISAIAFYLYLASKIFFEDKSLLIYELTQTNVRTVSAEIESSLDRAIEKLRSFGQTRKFSDHIDDLGFVQIGLIDSKKQDNILFEDFSKLKPYRKKEEFIKTLKERFSVPVQKVLKNKFWVRNASMDSDSPPLMLLAIPRTLRSKTNVFYAFMTLDYFLHAFPKKGTLDVYVNDSEGHVWLHSDQEKIKQNQKLLEDPLLAFSKESKVRSEVRKFESAGKTYLGSFDRTRFKGLTVSSKAEIGQAYAAARVLVRKSLLYAAIIITLALFISLFFSHSLTAPIERLVDATQAIAKGDFDKRVEVRSHDELSILASSFNAMTLNLKNSRAQIEEYSRDLEKKVAERTARLEAQNIAIKEAQEALVRTTRLASVGEVAGRAAHEVLNPLTNISTRLEKIRYQRLQEGESDIDLFSEIIAAWKQELSQKGLSGMLQSLTTPSKVIPEKTLLEEDLDNLTSILDDWKKRKKLQTEDVDFLLKETARISKIVNGMRQMTKVSSERKNINVNKVVNEAVDSMRDLLAKYEIAIETDLATENLEVFGDRDELLQVLTNLIRNSMQAFDGARKNRSPVPTIWVKTQSSMNDEKSQIEIRVVDNGPGIETAHAPLVFEPTFTTKKVAEGTGLGLSISRRFVRAMGGELILEKSIPNQETVFLIIV